MTPPNSGNFVVGQHIVCIDAAGITILPPLVKGDTYVVREAVSAAIGAGGIGPGPGVKLVGIPTLIKDGTEWNYASCRFRSLDEMKAESHLKSVVKQFLKEKANL